MHGCLGAQAPQKPPESHEFLPTGRNTHDQCHVLIRYIMDSDANKKPRHPGVPGNWQVALVIKNLPASAGDIRVWVLSLGQEDPLKKGMATHSGILAWRIAGTEEPGGLQSVGSQRVRHD